MSTTSRSGPTSVAEGQTVRIPCAECGRETVHSVVRAAEYVTSYDEGDYSITSWDEYQIVQCRGCESVGFRMLHSNTENTMHDPHTGEEELLVDQKLFPHRAIGRSELADAWRLPPAVARIYAETLEAIRASMPVLAGVGIRAIVEAVCRERDVAGGTLASRIDALVPEGVLTAGGAAILHSLRLLGNEAAHEVAPHSVETLNTAMDVVEHLLVGVYIIPERTRDLPQRRGTGAEGP